MAYDEGAAQMLRDDLAGETFTEQKMFGGLCFLIGGNMVCGVHGGGGMFRVGKANEAEAMKVRGAGPMEFTGRPMGGMVACGYELLEDDARRGKLLALAVATAKALPAKVPKARARPKAD